MQTSAVHTAPRSGDAVTESAAWIRACTSNVERAASAAEMVYGCFRTIAAQQAALATRVMTMATNVNLSSAGVPHMTGLSMDSYDLIIGGLIDALEAVRQTCRDVQRLIEPDATAPWPVGDPAPATDPGKHESLKGQSGGVRHAR